MCAHLRAGASAPLYTSYCATEPPVQDFLLICVLFFLLCVTLLSLTSSLAFFFHSLLYFFLVFFFSLSVSFSFFSPLGNRVKLTIKPILHSVCVFSVFYLCDNFTEIFIDQNNIMIIFQEHFGY